MSEHIPATGPHTAAFITAIEAAGITTGGRALAVGNHVAPDGVQPYAVVYRQAPVTGGPSGAPNADLDITYQVTTVAADPRVAEGVADAIRAWLLDPANRPAVAGRATQRVAYAGGQPVMRDDDVTPHLWYAADLYRLSTTPA